MPSGQFCGINLRSDLVSEFTFIESMYLPNQKHLKHSHECATFCLVLEGGFTETCGRTSLACSPSTLLFYPAGEVHTECFHDLTTRCFVIEIKRSWLENIQQFPVVAGQPASFQGGKVSGLALRAYKEFCAMDEFSYLSAEGLLLEMMAELSRSSRQCRDGRPIKRLELVKELLHQRFRESLTLATIAEQVGMHPVSLAQAFRKTCGTTVGEYVRSLRIEFACRELSNPDNPISEIAVAAGFFDQSHFTRTFKQSVGVTPAEFRKNLLSH